jgi:hypothetical protein
VTVTADVGEILALLWHDLWCNLFYNYSAAWAYLTKIKTSKQTNEVNNRLRKSNPFWFTNRLFSNCHFLNHQLVISFTLFQGDYNILNSGFADLSPFYFGTLDTTILNSTAVTMRSFSDEKKQGTLSVPLNHLNIWQIVSRKFWGGTFNYFSYPPTLIYVRWQFTP